MTTLLAMLVAAGLLAFGPPSAQAPIRPDFSGKWMPITPATPPPAPAGPTTQWSAPLTLTQDARTLTLEYVSYGRNHAPVKLVYSLDGSESKGVDRNAPTTPYDLVLRAGWRESRLVLRTVYLRPTYGDIEILDTLTLESPDTMVVETTRKVGDRSYTGTIRWRR